MRLSSFIFLLLFTHLAVAQKDSLFVRKKGFGKMGCQFEIRVVAKDSVAAWKAIEVGIVEIERIENLISSWDENSQTTAINRNSGIKPVKVNQELFNLIFRAKKVSQLTKGAFDISFASMDQIWRFDGSMTSMPDSIAIEKARAKINWQNIDLNTEQQSVLLKQEGMKIGFGAIGKGYAANKAKELMQGMPGVRGGVVNASGDLITWGESNSDKGWVIEIKDPKNINRSLAWLQINDLAIVTSGDYEKFIDIDGKRFAHIIDPRTGIPTSGIKSVTVLCADAELADALATSVFVLGVDEGIELIDKLKGIDCLIITTENEILTSNSLELNFF